jgi:glyoxylase-like metal-dependent hydrolase (beta-lactamase superfamily II)
LSLPAPEATGGTVNAYLLPGPPPVLVDPGPGTPAANLALAEELARHGIQLDAIRTILLTHAHPAHSGGAPQLAGRNGATLLAHPAAEAWLRDGQAAWAGYRTLIERAARAGGVPPALLDDWLDHAAPRHAPAMSATGWDFRPLAPGQPLRLAGDDWHVHFNGGHSVDHVSLSHVGGTTALTGDLLLRQGDTVPWLDARAAGSSGALAELIAAWRQIARLRQAVLWPGHGPEIRAHRILVARRLAAARSQLIAARAAVSAGADTVWAVAGSLELDLGLVHLPATLSTAAALLRWLQDQQQVERRVVDGVARFKRNRASLSQGRSR